MRLPLAACAVFVAATPAIVAGPLELTTRVLVEARSLAPDATVRTRLVAPAHVVPGDAVVVVVAYRNTGARPLADVVLVDPLPAGVAYRDANAGDAIEVSADGRSFAPLASLRVPFAGGGTRAAVAADVTHVRWRLAAPLAPGAQGERRVRAVLK